MIINGLYVAEPDDFTPVPENVYKNQMENGYGETMADFQRTKWKLSLKWSWLPPDILTELQTATNASVYPTISVTYPTSNGEQSGTFRVLVPASGTHIGYDNLYGVAWADITMELEEM